MDKNAKIYIAGHRGLVGSALARQLAKEGYQNILTRTHAELDLTNQQHVADFFLQEKPEYVFLAAAKVGGIYANNTFPAEFVHENLAIQTNVIHQAYLNDVKRLLFLGSSCIYPKNCPQPIKEEYLLTSELEPTNRPYALAKIAGIEMCWSYNRQYGTQYLAAMPTNLYGSGDNYHPENSHVIPGLLRRFHEAKINNIPTVHVWGSGKPRREFLYSDDMAAACLHLMCLSHNKFQQLLGSDRNDGLAPIVNLGCNQDIAISELAEMIKLTTAYTGRIVYDTDKPDGTMRKLMDSSRANAIGWQAKTSLIEGLREAYAEFIKSERFN